METRCVESVLHMAPQTAIPCRFRSKGLKLEGVPDVDLGF